MKNIQIKKPYVAPELTVVDFRVERGMNASVPVEAELDLMQIGYIQNEGNQSNLYAGDPMSDLGTGGYTFNSGSKLWWLLHWWRRLFLIEVILF